MKENRFFTSLYSEKTKRWVNFFAYQDGQNYQLFSDYIIEEDGFPGLFEENLGFESFKGLGDFEKFIKKYLRKLEEYPELFSRANALTKKVSLTLAGSVCIIKDPFRDGIKSLTDSPDEKNLGLCNYNLYYENAQSAAPLTNEELIGNLDRFSQVLATEDRRKIFSFEHRASSFFYDLEPLDWILNTSLAIQNCSEIFYNAGIEYFNTLLDRNFDINGNFYAEQSITDFIRYKEFSLEDRKKIFYDLILDFADEYADEHQLDNFSVSEKLDQMLALKLLDRTGYIVNILNSCVDYKKTSENFVPEFTRKHNLNDFYFEIEQNLLKDLCEKDSSNFTLKNGLNSLCDSLFKPVLLQLQQDKLTLKNQFDFLINPERIEQFKLMTGEYHHGAQKI